MDRYTMHQGDLRAALARTGFLRSARDGNCPRRLAGAVLAYQAFHGLDADGWAGTQTERHLNLERTCGHPDLMVEGLAGPSLGKWSDPRIKVHVNTKVLLRGFTADDMWDLARLALQPWSENSRLRFDFVTDASRANITTNVGKIDGPQKVLAWSKVPPMNAPVTVQLDQLLDRNENFGRHPDGAPPRGVIDIVRTWGHEYGHALGFGHVGQGEEKAPCLMDPIYSPDIPTLQAGDLRRLHAVYGTNPDDDGPKPIPPAEQVHVITLARAAQRITLRAA